jgi:hypothetical protein
MTAAMRAGGDFDVVFTRKCGSEAGTVMSSSIKGLVNLICRDVKVKRKERR